jgi:hypothetical protein
MPQATDELRDYWGGVDDGPAIKHLTDAGFMLTGHWTWVKPSPGYELTERDCKAVQFLADEWDFGWLEPTTTPETER